MNLSRVQDIKKAFLPVFLMNWMFGFGVIEYPMGRPRKLFSVCWAVTQFFICLGLLVLSEKSSILNVGGSMLSPRHYKIYIYTHLGLLVICLINGQVKAKSLDKCETISIQLNMSLMKLGIVNDYDAVFKSLLLQLCTTFIFIVTMTIINYQCFNFYFKSTTNLVSFQFVMHYFSYITFVIDFSFRAGIRYFKSRFRHVNEYLAKLNQQLRSTRDIRHPKTDLLTNSTDAFEYYRDLRLLKAREGQWMAHVVRDIRQIHGKICQSVNLLIDVYAIRILYFFPVNLIIITTLSYIIYVTLSSSDIQLPGKQKNDLFVILLIIWVLMYSLRMFVIIYTCSSTCSEAHKTGQLIHLLMNQATDQRVHDEIRTFSLQLLQNPLDFEICGFFSLNYAFFRRVISSITTFLVILIQMRGMYDIPSDSTNFTNTSLIFSNRSD